MHCPYCRAENQDGAEVCFKCGRAVFALTEGYVVASRYEIMANLGHGGMGTVYKAHDRELDETVALKILRGDLTKQPDLAKRFRTEIKLARRIRHRNVCGIHEYGQDGHLRYIAMELIKGVDFRRVIQEKGPLPEEEAFDVSIQIAEGLQAIHDEGIVHRDLKTPNIMRDARGVVRLMDFGLAKQWESDSGSKLTASGEILGTPEYMSPEQIRGEKIDARSDLYALGIVIFELFTGDVPFHGETPMATLFRHLQDPLPLTGSLKEYLPAPLVPILRKALAKEAVDRYPSAREMAEALRIAKRVSLAQTNRVVFTRRLRTATAPRLDTESAVLTPLPAQTPMPLPSLPPPPTADGEPASRPEPPRMEAPMEGARPAGQPEEGAGPRPIRPSLSPTPAEAIPPRGPAAARSSMPLEPALLLSGEPRATPPVRPGPKPAAAPSARPWAAALGVGILLVGGAVFVVYQRTTSREVAPPASLGAPTVTTLPSAPEVAMGSGEASVQKPAPSAVESLPPPITLPARTAKVSPAPAPAPMPELAHAAPRSVTREPPAPGGQGVPSVPSASVPTLEPARPSTSSAPKPVTPAPVERAAPSTTALPSPAPAAPPSSATVAPAAASAVAPQPSLEVPGTLALKVKPWADVTLDGRAMGRHLPQKLTLSPGAHALVLDNPDFEPFRRVLHVRPGEALVVTVDLTDEGVRRKR